MITAENYEAITLLRICRTIPTPDNYETMPIPENYITISMDYILKRYKAMSQNFCAITLRKNCQTIYADGGEPDKEQIRITSMPCE